MALGVAFAAAACASPPRSVSPAPVPASSASADSLTHDEITRQAVEVFGDSIGSVAAGDDIMEFAEEITWDIDVRSYETHARVEHYVRMFSGDASVRIAERLTRGSRYEDMIRQKLREGGLPEDMIYLALIESGFDPHAYSRAAAVGMWQFMTPTARMVGMRVDWWVDERRDPARSTDAAVSFLRTLRNQFGSLYLAAAAYNGGPTRVSRGLNRFASELEGTTGDDLFFALRDLEYLPRETREYVPQLIAAALVGKDPVRYGLQVQRLEPFVYDSVRVGSFTPLASVAHASGATLEEIRDLNPHILRGVTPPADSFHVRIPVGMAEGFRAAYLALPEAERTAFVRVTSRSGQSMASIARAHDLTAAQLGWYNPRVTRLRSGNLTAGQTILIPKPGVVTAARNVPDPNAAGAAARIHVVANGETLSHIARRHNTTVAEIQRLNNLRSTVIRPGQRLVVRR